MFLLKRQWHCIHGRWHDPLHSTMFLLKLICMPDPVIEILSFTFHNVSIKTSLGLGDGRNQKNSLHSTMFLLKPLKEKKWAVDIIPLHSTMFLLKPRAAELSVAVFDALHSTMFLLKHKNDLKNTPGIKVFTFHNVSIKTKITRNSGKARMFFTFHNVSIKTCTRYLLAFLSFLYIPQCFY